MHCLHKPTITAALANWCDEVMCLNLDTSLFWEEFCPVRLAVVHRGRALPVGWRVLAYSSASTKPGVYREILQDAVLLPGGVKVVFLADRGFGHTETMTLVRSFGWHYHIRLKSDVWLWRSSKG